ncbi:DUF3307 domain-containing protein [Candidatus Gracilibacteria bacterium]|nr:DUF3307 domain-containing protein [Candidatus Gracilibacteria bacterium]
MFVLFLLAHLVADFALQPLWLVQRKQRWDGLLIHVGIVLLCMLALAALEPAVLALWPAMLLISAIHLAADWGKVRYGCRIGGPPIVAFLLDQVIHIATLAVVLSLTAPFELVWGLTPANAMHALYAAGYVIVALAAPIALIVWLDPQFQHTARAARARLRSLFVGVGALSLVLFGGALALPLTLLGLVIIVQQTTVLHPLDSLRGRITLLTIAATIGTALRTFVGWCSRQACGTHNNTASASNSLMPYC